jgi:biotin carboxyl carrier protein
MESQATSRASFGGRWTYAVIALALLFVIMPFLFWNATWFGRPMTDAQLSQALADQSHPREIQHALAQLESRIEARDPAARRWYPQLVALSSDPAGEIRLTDAWVMGQDNSSAEFHAALLKLLVDSDPMVQRNAALSLVRFADASGHDAIVSMLRPYEITSPSAGKMEERLKPGEVVNPGTLLGHIATSAQSRELRATVPGTVEKWLVTNGAVVPTGQPVISIVPSEKMVWESLRALYLIGRAEDLNDVGRYAGGASGMPSQIAQQAQATEKAIRARSSP